MHMPEWGSVMSHQFENLVVNNLKSLCKILRIDLMEIVNGGPFFQRATQHKKGCQIDLLIQTKHRHFMYVKSNSAPLRLKVLSLMRWKKSLKAYPHQKDFP